MPELKIQQIVSASNSDDKYGPQNLHSAKKWRGKAGTESNSVILKLEKEEEIRTIFLGNEGSAYISVAVAKSCDILPSFNVLLSESAFMDPGECRMERNLQRVKSFDQSKLNSAFVNNKWDLVKVVCKQPYNKRIPFGISFISLIGGDENTEGLSPTRLSKLGVFKPATPSTGKTFFDSMTAQAEKNEKNAEEEEQKAVERAEKTQIRKEELMEQARQVRAQKRQAEDMKDVPSCSPSSSTILDSKGRPVGQSTPKLPKPSNTTTPSRTQTGMINANNTTPSRKNDVPKTILNITPKRRKSLQNQDESSACSSTSPPLSSVHFTLSGFENPLRGELREKACELGAIYCQDVNNELTHLVSAFKNTPKAKKCQSNVKLVSRHWIERCFVEKRHLNGDLFKL